MPAPSEIREEVVLAGGEGAATPVLVTIAHELSYVRCVDMAPSSARSIKECCRPTNPVARSKKVSDAGLDTDMEAGVAGTDDRVVAGVLIDTDSLAGIVRVDMVGVKYGGCCLETDFRCADMGAG